MAEVAKQLENRMPRCRSVFPSVRTEGGIGAAGRGGAPKMSSRAVDVGLSLSMAEETRGEGVADAVVVVAKLICGRYE